ncbi:rac GTPase-activating protein 1-like, partial [Chelydra serpentina]
HPRRGRPPGRPVPRGEQTAPRQPGHAGLPHAAPAEGRSEPRVPDGRAEPSPCLRPHTGGARHGQPHAPGHPGGHAAAVQERLFGPLSSPEMNSTRMSPTGCCLPDPLRSCVGTAATPLQALGSRKTGRFFPSLL